MHLCLHACMHVCVFVYAFKYVYMHVCIYIYRLIDRYICKTLSVRFPTYFFSFVSSMSQSSPLMCTFSISSTSLFLSFTAETSSCEASFVSSLRVLSCQLPSIWIFYCLFHFPKIPLISLYLSSCRSLCVSSHSLFYLFFFLHSYS